MGGVCPCLAGVDKAAGGTKAAPAPNSASAPLKESKQEQPATLPAKAGNDAVKKSEPAPVKKADPITTVPTTTVPLTSQAPAPAPVAGQPEAAVTGQQVQGEIGAALEVFSNSYNAWCPGVIQGCDSSSIFLAYQVPGEPMDANISTKTLPLDSTEIRLPEDTGAWRSALVEVYSHSNKAWCFGEVTEITGGVLSVVFRYPSDPADAVPVMKQLALGDKDLRLRGIDAAFAYPAGGIGHETLQVGSAVEVYSNSLGVWCPGVVQAYKHSESVTPDGAPVVTGVFTINFYYPDMDPSTEQPAEKDLPMGHQDLRLPGFTTGDPYLAGGTAETFTHPQIKAADCKTGAALEVYSQSRQAWHICEVKEVAEDMVTVQLRYPDMPDSELFEKVLPIGHQYLRLPISGKA